MLKDITLGQFFPGNTIVHRLDPRTKLMAVILYIVALFNAKSPLTYAIVAAVLAVCIVASRVPMKSLTRGLKPVYVIVAFTAVMNIFFTGGTAVGEGWLLGHITYEGLTAAIYMVLRIVMLIMGTFLLTYTTSPIALTDGLENLLGPLKKLHLPVHELAMMMSIALRFIPTLSKKRTRLCPLRRPEAPTLSPGTSSSGPRHWCLFWCRCSSALSAGRTSWPRPWSAGATTAARGGRPCTCCGIRRWILWCWRPLWHWRRDLSC